MTWVEFIEYPNDGRKTKVWRVQGKGTGSPHLGVIKWFGRWRQYTFHPAPETVFNPGCLRDIAAFVEAQTQAHRTERSTP